MTNVVIIKLIRLPMSKIVLNDENSSPTPRLRNLWGLA